MPRKTFKTLQAFVDSHPRRVRQGEIAAALGLTDAQLSAYLRKRHKPSPDVVARLAKLTGVPIESLLGVS